MGPGRRSLLLGALAAPAVAHAQPRQIRLIVPYPSGGSNDILARILQPRLSAMLGVAIQVENRAGRDGAAGAMELMRAPPNGMSWLMCFDSEATNATLLDLPYRLMDDLRPAGRIATGPVVVACGASRPWRNFADLAAEARTRVIDYATTGRGGIPHLAMLEAADALGLRLGQTTYRGGQAAAEDTIAGFVPVVVSNLPVIGAPLRAGTLRGLAVTTATESRHLPDVRGLAEQGVPGFTASTWWMMLGRAAAPEAAQVAMAQALASVLAEPDIVRRIEEQGVEVAPLGPAAARDFLAGEVERWGAVIRRHGVQ